MVKKKRSLEEIATTEPIAVEEITPASDLRAALEDVKNSEGVIGYILRNSTSASIDLKDSAKLIDYAILSSSAFEAGKEVSKLFNIGEVNDVMVEGKHSKVLSSTIKENTISVFMDKDADCGDISRRIHAANKK